MYALRNIRFTLILPRRVLLCIWASLITLVVVLILTYASGVWTAELLRSDPSAYPSIVIKAKLPSFLQDKSENKTSFRDLVDELQGIEVSTGSDVAKPSCIQLINWNKTALKLALMYQQNNPPELVADSAYPSLTSDCGRFIDERRYITEPITREEEYFPIAYSILVYEGVEQFERLLRSIFRPQNYYCVHIDLKSSPSFHNGIRAIASCFKNVFISSKLVDVQWGTYSVLEADLVCMQDLWKFNKWKYFINLTGKEFPLQTNLDLVKILKIFNGANNMEATMKMKNTDRTLFVHNASTMSNIRKSPPPIPVTLTKGSVHITASRAFVGYVLHDSRAVEFRNWVKDTGIPDETFFSSLNHSPHLEVPGAYKGVPETDAKTYPFFTRFKNWGSWPFDYPCYGLRLRRICIFGVGDLHLLSQRPEMFANKFQLGFQPLTLECMEEMIRNRTMEERAGTKAFDSSLYDRYEFIHNHT